jgi:hypothetical protein
VDSVLIGSNSDLMLKCISKATDGYCFKVGPYKQTLQGSRHQAPGRPCSCVSPSP